MLVAECGLHRLQTEALRCAERRSNVARNLSPALVLSHELLIQPQLRVLTTGGEANGLWGKPSTL